MICFLPARDKQNYFIFAKTIDKRSANVYNVYISAADVPDRGAVKMSTVPKAAKPLVWSGEGNTAEGKRRGWRFPDPMPNRYGIVIILI